MSRPGTPSIRTRSAASSPVSLLPSLTSYNSKRSPKFPPPTTLFTSRTSVLTLTRANLLVCQRNGSSCFKTRVSQSKTKKLTPKLSWTLSPSTKMRRMLSLASTTIKFGKKWAVLPTDHLMLRTRRGQHAQLLLHQAHQLGMAILVPLLHLLQ